MLSKLKTAILLPLLLLQGLWVLIKTPRLPEAQGQRTFISTKTSHSINVLIIGDSAAAGVGVTSQNQALSGQLYKQLQSSASVRLELNAWSGCTTREMIRHLDSMQTSKVDLIITSLGVNDVLSPISASKWLSLQQQLINTLNQKFPAAAMIITAVPAMEKFTALPSPLNTCLGTRAHKFNQLLQGYLLTQPNCHFLWLDVSNSDSLLANDGFHPNAKGYALWASEISALIPQCLIPSSFNH